MKTDTSEKIIQYIRKNGLARPDDIGRFLGIGQVAVHRQLKKLTTQGELEKTGKPPLVFYMLITNMAVDRISESLKSDINQSVAPNPIDDILALRQKTKISSQELKSTLEQSRKELLERI